MLEKHKYFGVLFITLLFTAVIALYLLWQPEANTTTSEQSSPALQNKQLLQKAINGATTLNSSDKKQLMTIVSDPGQAQTLTEAQKMAIIRKLNTGQ